MLRTSLFAAFLGLMLMPAFAHAQFNEGDWALRLAGAGSSDNDFDVTTVTVNGEVDYFLADYFSVGLDQGMSFADAGDSTWSASTRLGADFYVDADRWQPYFGLFIGYLYGDDDVVEEQFIAGPEVGVAYFVNASTFIFGEVEYQFLFEDADDADESFDDGIFAYSLGIGFTF